ncbi:MAG: hypothetical protein MJ053_05410 [Elusimicrobiaceae bacterium]|nr:hypothetical protein [Elusimicrobiaceae bacterium]
MNNWLREIGGILASLCGLAAVALAAPVTQVQVVRPSTTTVVTRPVTTAGSTHPTTTVAVSRPVTTATASHPTTTVEVIRPTTTVVVAHPRTPAPRAAVGELTGFHSSAQLPAANPPGGKTAAKEAAPAGSMKDSYKPLQAKDFKAAQLGKGDNGLGNKVNEAEKDAAAASFKPPKAEEISLESVLKKEANVEDKVKDKLGKK